MADFNNAIANFKASVREALSDAVTVGDVVQQNLEENHYKKSIQ